MVKVTESAWAIRLRLHDGIFFYKGMARGTPPAKLFPSRAAARIEAEDLRDVYRFKSVTPVKVRITVEEK